MPTNETETFTIKVTMQTRWIPHFIGMLNFMQKMGGWGSSREVTFFSDGDGDFRPKFEYDRELPEAAPMNDDLNHPYFDAG